jgi:oligopeptide transport system ATP-binding protein
MGSGTALLEVANLDVRFEVGGGLFRRSRALHAVQDVSFSLARGEALGIVGESGSGKSTLVRAALRLQRPSAGSVTWLGRSVERETSAALRSARVDRQMVFQDPIASLDPRMTVRDILFEPFAVHRPAVCRTERERAAVRMLERVAMPARALDRYPHEFSGGQCQRIAIARAMILEPALLVCDEAVSALDMAVQAQVLALIADLRRERGTAVLFVSHSLAVVQSVCDRVLVLYLGRVVEEGPVSRVLGNPQHPYTRELVAAVPVLDPDVQRNRLPAPSSFEVPSPMAIPAGCAYRPRCAWAVDVCQRDRPMLDAVAPGHRAACHRIPLDQEKQR